MRIDVLAVTLIRSIIPSILRSRNLAQKLRIQLQERKQSYTGNDIISSNITQDSFPKLAFFIPDEHRDREAEKILKTHGAIRGLRILEVGGVVVDIASMNSWNTVYNACVYAPKDISCTCMDFRSRGGFCKHLRAGFHFVKAVRNFPDFSTLPEPIYPRPEACITILPAECSDIDELEQQEIVKDAIQSL